MNTIYAIIFAIIGSISSCYFYFQGQVTKLNESISTLEQEKIELKNSRPTSYGQLSSVNRVELTTTSIQQQCLAWDWEGWGQGGIDFKWEHEFSYGVDVPADYKWEIIPLQNGKAQIILPELTQLRPIKVEYYSFNERNDATGKQWENMLLKTTPIAKKWLETAAINKLESDRNVIEGARATASKFLLPLINEAIKSSDKTPYLYLEVVFENEDKIQSKPAQLYPDNCKELI